MKFPTLHAWDLTPKAAIALQKELAGRVRTDVPVTACKLIAIPEKRFLFLVQQTPYFSLQIMRVMAERLRKMNTQR